MILKLQQIEKLLKEIGRLNKIKNKKVDKKDATPTKQRRRSSVNPANVLSMSRRNSHQSVQFKVDQLKSGYKGI